MIGERIRYLSRLEEGPGRCALRFLRGNDIRDLVQLTGMSVRDVEVAALEQEVVPERYLRNVGEIGIQGQLTLLRSHAAVVGLGGLGGYVLEHMARMGVGELSLIDGDMFVESNLNRQLLSEVHLLGTSKAQAALKRVQTLNPAVSIHIHEQFILEENASALLDNARVVLDGLDQISARFTLEQSCRRLNIPIVHAAVSGWAGQVMTIFPKDQGLEILYRTSRQTSSDDSSEESMLPMAAACIASIQAAEAVKVLLGRDGLLRGRALLVDIAQNWFQVVEFGKEE